MGCHSEESKQKIGNSNKGKPSPMKGKHHSKEAKQKISEKNKGNLYRIGCIHTEESNEKNRNSHIGKTHNKETIQKIKNKTMGKKRSLTTKNKISEANRNRIQKLIVCEYCGKKCIAMNYKKWHGDNCKNKLL